MFSQKKYPNVMLGNSNTSIAKAGCFITSYSNLLEYYGRGLTPPEVNEVAKKCGAFSGANLIAPNLSEALNLSYERVSDYNGGGVVIAETNHYKVQGVPQHFYLLDTSSGKMVDPLSENPSWVKNKYNVVSYRIINNLNKMEKEFVEIISKIIDKDLGSNINEKEQKESAKKLKEFYEGYGEVSARKFELEEAIKFLQEANKGLIIQNDQRAVELEALTKEVEKLKTMTGDCESKTITQLLGVIISKIIKSNGTN